jgi:hypothetical protein
VALPAFHSAGPAVSHASNLGLTLTCPTGDPSGTLLIAFIVGYAAGGPPSAPAGWRGPFGSGGVWAFTKPGVLADSGDTVFFAAWTPEVIGTDNSGVIVAYDNAAGFDLVKPAVNHTLSGFNLRAYFPQGRTAVAQTIVFAVAGFAERVNGTVLDIATPGALTDAGTTRVAYSPDGGKAFVYVNEERQASAGQTAARQVFASGPGVAKLALFALRDNQPPTAPNLTSPAAGATLDSSQPHTFSWVFGDPDPADRQSAFDINFTNLTTPSSVTSSGTTDQFFTRSFLAGDFTWKVRTYDSDGNVGPFSPVRSFTAVNPPATPVITAPTSGATITAPTVTLTWTAVTADQASYEFRRVADSGGVAVGQVYSDSGQVTDAAGRSVTVTFDTTGRDEHVQVRTLSTAGIWSPWADVLVHVAFTPPPTPSLLVTADDTTASILIQPTNPAPTGSVPPATSNDIYRQVGGDSSTAIRVATGLTVNTPWTDYTPASGVDYEYQVVAVADDGATAASHALSTSGRPYGSGPYGSGPYGGS